MKDVRASAAWRATCRRAGQMRCPKNATASVAPTGWQCEAQRVSERLPEKANSSAPRRPPLSCQDKKREPVGSRFRTAFAEYALLRAFA